MSQLYSSSSSSLFSSSIATMYDEILGPVFFEPYAIDTATRVAALHPLSVLEIACGTGRVTNHLRSMLPTGTSLTATDISTDMMSVAKQKLAAVKNITWMEADALNLHFPDESFDVVVCQFGAMFFQDKTKAFNETFRVLKKNGTFIFAVWDKLETNNMTAASRQILREFFDNKPPATMGLAFSMTNKEEIQATVEACGFTDVKIETVAKPSEAESAAQLAAATVEGSIIRDFILAKDAAAIPVLKKKIEEAIRSGFGDHPVRGTMQAIIVTVKKSNI